MAERVEYGKYVWCERHAPHMWLCIAMIIVITVAITIASIIHVIIIIATSIAMIIITAIIISGYKHRLAACDTGVYRKRPGERK